MKSMPMLAMYKQDRCLIDVSQKMAQITDLVVVVLSETSTYTDSYFNYSSLLGEKVSIGSATYVRVEVKDVNFQGGSGL